MATAFGASEAIAQQDGEARLVISVATEAGDPITAAVVAILEASNSGTTDAAGLFDAVLQPGSYTVRVSAIGFTPEERLIEWDGMQGPAPFSLARVVVTLPAIEVRRERTEIAYGAEDIPGSVAVISSEDLSAADLLVDDIHSLLRRIPGITIQEEDGYGLRPNIGMRGTGSQRSSKITLMEDGVLIAPAPYAAPAAYYFPVVGRMSSVEVRKGSSQIKYGPRTIGGALNLVSTPIPDAFRFNADVVGGENTTRKLNTSIGWSTENFGWLAETYQIASDGFKRLDDGGDTGFEVHDYVFKLRVNSDRTAINYHELELKFGVFDEHSNETYLGLTVDDFLLNPSRRYRGSQLDVIDAVQRQLSARYFARFSDRVDLTTTIYRNDFERNWFKLQSVMGTGISNVLLQPDVFSAEMEVLRGAGVDSDAGALTVRANNREYFGRGAQSVLALRMGRFGMSHEIEIGARYHEDEEDRFQHEDSFQMSGGRMILTSAGAPGSQSNRVSEARAIALFVQDKITVGDLSFTPGVRFESIRFKRTDYSRTDPLRTAPVEVRRNSVAALIPGLGVNYRAAPGLRIFGGIHRGFGPPGPGADDATDPEQSLSYELGARYIRSFVSAEVVGFYSNYGNVLGEATLSTGGSGSGALFNGGEVDVFGLEVSANSSPVVVIGNSFPLRLPMSAALTLTSAEFKTDFASDYEPWGSVQAGDKLPYLPPVQVHLSSGIESSTWGFELAAYYQSTVRTVAGRGEVPANEATDSYVIFDLSAEYSLGAQKQIFGAVRNLTDRHYVAARRPAGVRPGLPRTLMLGLRLRY